MAPPWAAIGMGIGALGNLFSNPARGQADQQIRVMKEQQRIRDAQRPYSNAMFDPRQNPILAQKMSLGQQGNLFNWGAMANRMTPNMLALLNTVAPQVQGAPQGLPGILQQRFPGMNLSNPQLGQQQPPQPPWGGGGRGGERPMMGMMRR